MIKKKNKINNLLPKYLILRILVFPIALLIFIFYVIGIKIRNLLYEYSIFKTFFIPIDSICVGNITIGGTGKTPMIAYLLELLSSNREIGVLSRGYGRKTKGFLKVTKDNTAEDVGDEPLQLFKKYGNKNHFFVCENRFFGYKKIKNYFPQMNCLLLDDGFQHRAIKTKIQLVLMNYHQPVFEDTLMPFGLLREPISALERADAIIISKCPKNISFEEKKEWKQKINENLTSSKNIFFSTIKYLSPYQKNHTDDQSLNKNSKFILITGIANPTSIEKYVNSTYTLIEHLKFADHQVFREKEIKQIQTSIHKNKTKIKQKTDKFDILTTEKDYIRLEKHIENGILLGCKIYSLPISIEILADDIIFEDFLLKQLG